ncbi:MAG: hypothetical protein GX247_00365 [Mollicutes bacterium]|nr:hypothetical protein [Mollicutes bacterium]
MKKILILLMLILITGCTNNNEKKYYALVKELKQIETTTINIPFDITIVLDKITDNEIVYNAVIDNAQEEIKDVVALVTNDQVTNKMYPSIGIFDKKIKIVPSHKEINDDSVKGIALVGYLPFDKEIEEFSGIFKVYVEFTLKGKRQKIYYIYKI